MDEDFTAKLSELAMMKSNRLTPETLLNLV